MTEKYILDENGEPQRCNDLIEWAEWYEAHFLDPALIVGQTEIRDSTISTVFTCLDYQLVRGAPPLIWETLIVGGPYDRYSNRYSTRAEAERGHQEWVERIANDE